MPKYRSSFVGRVSIHAPARGATHGVQHEGAGLGFQSTPLREGRRPIFANLTASHWFQSTPLREGRQYLTNVSPFAILFQSTPLREGRRTLPSPVAGPSCFNPRPCARGDDLLVHLRLEGLVSIHAPARGATVGIWLLGGWIAKFQSTPLREGRRRRPGRGPVHRDCFNPRPCARGDRAGVAEDQVKLAVSIHAPARGATGGSSCSP